MNIQDMIYFTSSRIIKLYDQLNMTFFLIDSLRDESGSQWDHEGPRYPFATFTLVQFSQMNFVMPVRCIYTTAPCLL